MVSSREGRQSMSCEITPEILSRWDQEAQRLADLVASLSDAELNQPVAGEWSARQILTHMLDAEIFYGTRLRTAIATPGAPVTAFDQDAVAANIPSQGVSIRAIADAFLALRQLNTALLMEQPATTWDRTIEHPERGTQTLCKIVQVFGNHVAEHLAQLEAAMPNR